jgi:ferredoxin-thioredoxin reductase catalytic subunit
LLSKFSFVKWLFPGGKDIMAEDKEVLASKISKFAEDNGLQLHPGQDAMRWAELVIKKGGCPCVPGRKECPCSQALEDIARLNRCRCGIFVNAAYIEEYNSLQAARKPRRRRDGQRGKKQAIAEDQH